MNLNPISAAQTHSALAERSGAIVDRLARAQDRCARRGVRLTDTRREVLALILEAREPVGAYTLLDRLKCRRGQGQPPTVYRALDFLLENGLIHRVEKLNAFVGCHDEAEHHHPAQFLICAACGNVTEMEDTGIARAVQMAAGRAGFAATRSTVEVDGYCKDCSGKPQQKDWGGGSPPNPVNT